MVQFLLVDFTNFYPVASICSNISKKGAGVKSIQKKISNRILER